MEESFDFGLERVLDGIELYVKSAKRQSAGREKAAERSRARTRG